LPKGNERGLLKTPAEKTKNATNYVLPLASRRMPRNSKEANISGREDSSDGTGKAGSARIKSAGWRRAESN
jgi:hypothetical protein